MKTTNAICQRIGHRHSGKRHGSGLPVCATCGKPFDDTDGTPQLFLNTFDDPDGDSVSLAVRKAPQAVEPIKADIGTVTTQELPDVIAALNQLAMMIGRPILFKIVEKL